MVIEDELGAQLGARLHEELADLSAPAELAGTVRRRRSRQRWAVSGALAVPVVAAGVALALTVGGTPTGVPGQQPAQAGPAQPHNVAYVVAQSQKALSSIGDYVVHSVTTVDDGTVHDTWSDVTGQAMAGTTTAAGAANQAISMTIHGDQLVLLTVDYQHHTWWQDKLPKPDKLPAGAFGVPYGDPSEIRTELGSGDLTLIGTEQVDGRTAEHLRLNAGDFEPGQVGMDLWVDEASYLPVKLTGHKGTVNFTVSYEWLPRTPENLAKTTLAVPSGFTQTPIDKAANPAPTGSGKG